MSLFITSNLFILWRMCFSSLWFPPALFITAGVSLPVLTVFSVCRIVSSVVVVASSSTPSTFYLRVSLGLSGESDALNLCVNYHVRDNNQSTGNMRHRPRQIEQCVSWGFEVSVPLCITMRPVLAARRFQKSKSYCQVKHKVEHRSTQWLHCTLTV